MYIARKKKKRRNCRWRVHPILQRHNRHTYISELYIYSGKNSLNIFIAHAVFKKARTYPIYYLVEWYYTFGLVKFGPAQQISHGEYGRDQEEEQHRAPAVGEMFCQAGSPLVDIIHVVSLVGCELWVHIRISSGIIRIRVILWKQHGLKYKSPIIFPKRCMDSLKCLKWKFLI